MAKFPGLTLTTNGINMIVKSQAGSELMFTKIEIGDGEIDIGENLKEITALKHACLSGNISAIDTANAGQVSLTSIISNTNVDVGFYEREIGIWAKIGTDGEERLYAYSNAGNYATYIPDKTEPIDESKIRATIVIGNSSSVSAAINASIVYVTKEMLNAHNEDLSAHAAAFAAHTNEFGVATLKRDRAYVVGDIAYSNHLPTWARLECVTAGKTALTEPDLSTVTTAGAYILDGKVKWILADVRDAAPVGELCLYYSLHPGYVKANGAVASRADYPRLVAFAETNNLWVDYTLKFSGTTTANSATVTGISSDDMAKLQREMKVTGTGIPVGTTISKLNRTALTITLSAVATTAGKIDITYGYNENFPERFGVGDGSTTFTLPNAIGRVLEAGTSVGNTAAGLPNITGDISTSANMQTAGAFYGSSGPAYGEYHGDFGHTVFDASRSSVIYGNAATVQAQSLGLLPQLRY